MRIHFNRARPAAYRPAQGVHVLVAGKLLEQEYRGVRIFACTSLCHSGPDSSGHAAGCPSVSGRHGCRVGPRLSVSLAAFPASSAVPKRLAQVRRSQSACRLEVSGHGCSHERIRTDGAGPDAPSGRPALLYSAGDGRAPTWVGDRLVVCCRAYPARAWWIGPSRLWPMAVWAACTPHAAVYIQSHVASREVQENQGHSLTVHTLASEHRQG